MTRRQDNSLSVLARRLLVAERERAESAATKERAMLRARAAFEATRLVAGKDRGAFGRFSASSAGRLPRLGLLAGAFALAGLAAAAVNLLAREPRLQPRARQASSVPTTTNPVQSAPLIAPSLEPRVDVAPSASSVAAVASHPWRRPTAAPARLASARQYAVELELLEPARRAIARGSYGEALDAAARHERAFPSGQLAEERSALRVRALWASGRRVEAQAAAARFREGYPRSGLLNWMRERTP